MLCPDCEVIRTKRSRHCNICNRCVERFDHHCPWINNCVGAGNHIYFLLFLFSVFLTLLIVIVGISLNIRNDDNLGDVKQSILTIFPLSWYGRPMFFVGSVIVYLVAGSFLLPVALLMSIHMRNFCLNRTTNERFARRGNYSSETSESRSTSLATTVDEDEVLESGCC